MARTRSSRAHRLHVSLPRFFDRVADAAVPLLEDADPELLRARLDRPVGLRLAGDAQLYTPAFDLAANLLGRLYPRIWLDAPAPLAEAARAGILAINPQAEVLLQPADTAVPGVVIGPAPAEADAHQVSAHADGWTVRLDDLQAADRPPHVLASLAAACLGVGELFRWVFAAELGAQARRGPTPARLNLISLQPEAGPDGSASIVDIGRVNLVGAGAIGQAALFALRAAGVGGELRVIEPELLELSNLQRYVLSGDADVGVAKVELASRALSGSRLKVSKQRRRWAAELASDWRADGTLVALDSAQDRIGVQAALPGPIYNAWTQPRDLGWSRHEQFGEQPCLACLYWPTASRPHRHELIAHALGEAPLRVLAYLTAGLPVGLPLPLGAIPALPGFAMPADAELWQTRSLLDDLAERFSLAPGQLADWQGASLDVLYREVVCGVAMLNFALEPGVAQEAAVPLAHQSALAGVMLAVQLVAASDPALRAARPAAVEGRLNVLADQPQVPARPRQRTPGCLCSDPDFLAVQATRGRSL